MRRPSDSFHGSFKTSLDYDIAEDEPDIKVFYTFDPAEPMTRDYSGSPASVAIDKVVGLERGLSPHEVETAMSGDFLEALEIAAWNDAMKEQDDDEADYEYQLSQHNEWIEEQTRIRESEACKAVTA